MKFALIYQYDPTSTGPSDQEVQDWLTLDHEVRAAGIFVHEAGFHHVDAAQSVQVRDGVVSRIDGVAQQPGQEIVAGFYLVDCEDVDTAVAWAERIPTARYGTVQVRPVVDYTG
jgi:hypothetical protein